MIETNMGIHWIMMLTTTMMMTMNTGVSTVWIAQSQPGHLMEQAAVDSLLILRENDYFEYSSTYDMQRIGYAIHFDMTSIVCTQRHSCISVSMDMNDISETEQITSELFHWNKKWWWDFFQCISLAWSTIICMVNDSAYAWKYHQNILMNMNEGSANVLYSNEIMTQYFWNFQILSHIDTTTKLCSNHFIHSIAFDSFN